MIICGYGSYGGNIAKSMGIYTRVQTHKELMGFRGNMAYIWSIALCKLRKIVAICITVSVPPTAHTIKITFEISPPFIKVEWRRVSRIIGSLAVVPLTKYVS
jgi:hypothetical protein